MADNDRRAALCLDRYVAVLTSLASVALLADLELVVELQVIDLLPILASRLIQLEIAIRVGAVRFRRRAAIDGDFRMMLVDLIDLRVYISNLLVDIRLDLMELILCSSTAADIGTILVPGLVVQIGDILASLVGLVVALPSLL